MKHLRWVMAVSGVAWLAAVSHATSPNDPADQRLRVIYQRLHFNQQYPPEAAQHIQAKLQDTDKVLDVLGELAGDNRAEVRSLVCMLLGEYGEADGGKLLWNLMRDDSEPVRMSAAAGLARLAQFTSFPVSTENLKDERPEVRRFAAATVGKLGDKSAESALIEALQDDNEMVRMEVARSLASCGTEDCVPPLIERLQDRSVFVRQSAALTLGHFSSPGTAEALSRALKDPDWHVRAAIIESLAMHSEDPIIRGQVTEHIIRHLQSDDYALVRDRAADALATSTDDKVIDALVRALVSDERQVRFHAAQAIIKGRSVSALPKLMEARNHPDPEVREKVVEILGRIGGSEQLPAVIDATNDPEPQVQLAAVNALRRLRERGATDKLVTKLSDSNPHVRAAVCRALGDLGEKTVCPKIVPLLRDESSYVRSAAAEALGKLGDRTSITPLMQVLTGEKPSEGQPELGGVVIGTGREFLAEFAQLTEVQQKARAIEALGVLRAPEAVDTIIKFGLKADDAILRAVSAYSLGQIKDQRAVEPLQEAVRPFYSAAPTDLEYVIDSGANKVSDEARRMKEKESRVRASVAWALGQIGDPTARETLLKAVNDQNSLVRDAAVEALAKISEREEKMANSGKSPVQ